MMIDICTIIHQIINMRHLFFLITIAAALFLSSCSSEETPEERLIGSWTGSFIEPDFGITPADITIRVLSTDETNVQVAYGVNDKSLCNNDLFFCDEPAQPCAPIWRYNGFANGVYTFVETPTGEFCAPGLISLRFQSDDVLNYNFVGTEEPDLTSSGTLERL